MTIVTNYIAQQAAIQFMDFFQPGSNNSLYLYLGQQTPWVNEPVPDPELASIASYQNLWDNMIFLKNVTQNNMQLVVPMSSWTNNTIYTAATDTNSQLFLGNIAPFYIFTSNNELYKCLSNNNSANSVIQPSGLGSPSNNYTQMTSDGYVWKYMLNVENGGNFLNSFWIPVPLIPANSSFQQIVQSAAVPGSIDIINVNSGGNGYLNNPQSYNVTITGNGTGANAYAIVTGNQVQQIVMVSRGQGYNYATATFSDGIGSGAIITAVIPPPGGNGSDAAAELGASAVMVAIETSNSENGFLTVTNAFRVNGLLYNPLLFNSNTIASNTDIAPYTTLSVTPGVGNFAINEMVYQGTSINNATFSGIVIDFDPILNILRLNNVRGLAGTGDIVYGVTSGSQRYLLTSQNPDVQLYTGQIIVIDNLTLTQRQIAQIELFQYVVTF